MGKVIHTGDILWISRSGVSRGYFDVVVKTPSQHFWGGSPDLSPMREAGWILTGLDKKIPGDDRRAKTSLREEGATP